jgi:hypothetical protein
VCERIARRSGREQQETDGSKSRDDLSACWSAAEAQNRAIGSPKDAQNSEAVTLKSADPWECGQGQSEPLHAAGDQSHGLLVHHDFKVDSFE